MVVYPTYSSTCVDGKKTWISETEEIAGKRVQTSRRLVPPRSTVVSLRMTNRRDVAVRLHKGVTVAELQPVNVMETVTSSTKVERQQECISELIRERTTAVQRQIKRSWAACSRNLVIHCRWSSMIWAKLESSNIILILGNIHRSVKRYVDIHHLIYKRYANRQS